MPEPAVVFDGIWKKFRRGERHDSLRDLVPALVRGAFSRAARSDLGDKEFWALRDVSFEVQSGEALGIIGPNGAGKSTTLKLLTKILKPTRGHCAVRGRVSGLIEVAAGFHPDLTGRENVALQGAIMGMSPAECRQQFDAIVEFADVAAFIDTPVKRYSSGMNTRLGFSIAAHLNPDVFLIDEALSVGDAVFQQKCLERIRTLKERGTALVFVSHNLAAVESISDKIAVLHPVHPSFVASPREAIRRYLGPGQRADSQPGLTMHGAARRAHIRSVRLCDPAGEEIAVVVSGTPLSIEVDVTAESDPVDARIGLRIHDSSGVCVYGENSSLGPGNGTVHSGEISTWRMNIQSFALPAGEYTVSAALRSAVSNEIYDRRDFANSIRVELVHQGDRSGSVGLSTEWVTRRQEHSGAPVAQTVPE
jgi:lipopolysaccharide transport system ATP-binding protein